MGGFLSSLFPLVLVIIIVTIIYKMMRSSDNNHNGIDPSKSDAKNVVTCRQCETAMKKTKKANKSMALQVLGVLVFFVGVVLLFYMPIGTIIGMILMVTSLSMGYSQKKIWSCPNCGYFFERAK